MKLPDIFRPERDISSPHQSFTSFLHELEFGSVSQNFNSRLQVIEWHLHGYAATLAVMRVRQKN